MFKERLMEIARRQKSVNDFSRKCGISNSLMISYLNGKSLPGLENLLKMAAAAQVSVQWLASGLGPVQADAEMLKSGRQREEAARRLAMVEKWVEGARVLAGQRISPNLL
ncbi:MAG: helix-turn-helix domain-containing protein, partial [Nitrospinota bacterium]|nr:helix-turn-helix domain-containing protein [Nitrospinota bacterium]